MRKLIEAEFGKIEDSTMFEFETMFLEGYSGKNFLLMFKWFLFGQNTKMGFVCLRWDHTHYCELVLFPFETY